MSTLRKTVSFLALGVLMAACGTDANRSAEAPKDLERQYGFVSLVDGAVGVVDLQTMSVVHKVKGLTHHASHMLQALPAERELIMGDWDSNEVLVLRFGEDYTSHEVVERIQAPVQMHGFMTRGDMKGNLALAKDVQRLLEETIKFIKRHSRSTSR